jgi:DNA polymerase III epsilon subunit-like protein
MLRLTRPLPSVLDGQQIVVVDVEGNGQREPEIVEIAALPISGATPVQLTDLRIWLVRPRQPITPIVTRKVHGIRNEDVACCPPWRDIAPHVAQLLAGRVLVAHSASVERNILTTHLPGWEPALVLDTMRLARALWPGLIGYGLERLITHARITPPPMQPGQRAHRAGYDAVMTAELFVLLVSHAVVCDGLGWAEIVEAARFPGSARSGDATGDDRTGDGTTTAAEPPEAGLW